MSFMDLLLGRKHAPMIGLDISSSSAKLVELGQAANGEYVVERLWRDAKLLEIGGGTLEAHQKNITRELVKDPDLIVT